jgi:tyrosinase
MDLPIDFTSTDVEPEHWLAYFREDIALNLHHWHWHILFPFADIKDNNGGSLLDRDRRGELFFYMHHQIIAR